MKLLIDNALSPVLAELLCSHGIEAIHLRDIIDPSAPDTKVFETAAQEDRVLISADTDFGVILANREATKPSVILLRHGTPANPIAQCELIVNVLNTLSPDLEKGCIVSVNDRRMRVRLLPLNALR